MKKILEIFMDDCRRVFTNVWATIIVIGIMIIPALYAWFNINSNWDPYSATAGIKIAVVNLDEGAEIEGMNVNAGGLIVQNLAENDEIGWQFVDEETAMDGVDSGAYYAAIVIPADFSSSLGSIATLVVDQPTITYYINEKKNAIAPKIANTGVTTVQTEVNETFVETVSSVLGSLLKNTYSSLEDEGNVSDTVTGALQEIASSLEEYQTLITAITNACDSLESSLESAQNLLPTISDTITQTETIAGKADTLIRSSESSASQLSSLLGEALNLTSSAAQSIQSQLSAALSIADSGLGNANSDLNTSLDRIASAISSDIEQTARIVNALDTLETSTGISLDGLDKLVSLLEQKTSDLNTLNTRITDAKSTLAAGESLAQSQKTALQQAAADLTDLSTQAVNIYNSSLLASIDSVFADLNTELDSLGSLEGTGSDAIDNISSSLGSMTSAITSADNALAQTSKLISNAQDKISGYIDEIENAAKNEKIEKIEELIERDPELISAFMKSPVNIDTESVYPIANYGSQMAPFYTCLAIWVGALVNCALIKTKVKGHKKPEEEISEPVQIEQYTALEDSESESIQLEAGLDSSIVISLADLESIQSSQTLSAQILQPDSVLETGTETGPDAGLKARKQRLVKAIKSPKPDPSSQEKPEYTPDQEYFGRYLFFAFVSICQALIICLGDLYILKIQCLNPFLFCFIGIVGAISFSLLMYTLTVSFGDVGKAIAVILMVIQVAGSGGTYPIEILPEFYQALYPFYPFNYVINGMRECIGGIYENAFWIDVLKECCFIPVSLFIGLALRKPIMHLKDYIEERVESTGLIG